MKRCRKCLRDLPLTEFYRHAQMGDGHLNFCRVCVRERVRFHRRVNDSVRQYDRTRAKTAARKLYSALNRKQYRENNPEKYKAHSLVGHALKTGKLQKRPCEECGAERTHAHHDDYAKPLEVRWLCALCHHRHHAQAA